MKKSLLDIQQEVRNLDNKVKDVSVLITEIYRQIDSFRDDETAVEIDYEKIQLFAQKMKFGRHPLYKVMDSYVKRKYVEALLCLVHLDTDSEHKFDRLVFIQWIMSQVGLEFTLEDLMKNSLKADAVAIRELIEILPTMYRDHLVMDALIIANICGRANDDVLHYVANLANVFELKKDKLRILAILAKSALMQKLGKIQETDVQPVLMVAKKFKHYLNDTIIEQFMSTQIRIVVKVPDSECYDFKWKAKQQVHVREGDIVAEYYTRGNNRSWLAPREFHTITTPIEGTLFQFRHNCVNYGVVAHASKSKGEVKAWALGKEK